MTALVSNSFQLLQNHRCDDIRFLGAAAAVDVAVKDGVADSFEEIDETADVRADECADEPATEATEAAMLLARGAHRFAIHQLLKPYPGSLLALPQWRQG